MRARPSLSGRRRRRAPLVAAALLAACARHAPPETPTVVLKPEGREPVTVRVEIADSPEERSRGLMYRNELDEDQGMLFVFERDGNHGFWMKNTPLSLDLIFLSADGRIVGIVPDAEPFSLKSMQVGTPSRMVLEVRAGFARRHGLRVGDLVALHGVRSAPAS